MDNFSLMSGLGKTFRNMSLVRKFSVAAAALIFIIMIIVGTLIISYQKRSLKAEMETGHRVLADKLALDVVEPLIFMDPLRLDELARSTSRTPACVHAGVADVKGRIVAHTSRKMLGKTISADMKRSLFEVARGGEAGGLDTIGDGIREIVVPVKAGYEIVGAVFLGFSIESVDTVVGNNLKGLKRYLLFIFFIAVVAGIWGAYALARFLATPIKELRDRMELVQAGNLDVENPRRQAAACHEILQCGMKECPAYAGERCWTIPGTLCFGGVQGDVFDKLSECRKCPVYSEACGDEIGELVEVFYQMISRLRESIRELEESNREKARLEKFSALGEMSMTVAHEIKNPLNAIRGAASYLRDNFEGEVLQEFLSIIEEETKRLNEIVTSILRYSKPVPLKARLADINRMVRDTVDLIRQEATENNVDVVVSLDEQVPQFSFDLQQLKQALLNMLVNSLEVTKAGDTIRITTALDNSRVRISVEDTGTGISEEVLPEVFKPYFTTKTRGSGLGLACVERIVKDHKGEISIRSSVSSGTEITIRLPVRS